MKKDWTEMEIAAWIDGELTGPQAERIALLVENDPEAAAAASRLSDMNDLLKEAFAAPMAEAAPAAMRASLLGAPGKVAVLRRRSFRPPMAAFAALAASVALAVGLGLGSTLLSPETGAVQLALGAGPAPEAAAEAFETAASGAVAGGVRPLASFETTSGPCREFEALGAGGSVSALGLACRAEGGGWSVRVLAEAPSAEGAAGGFAPASGAAADAVGALLDALAAGPALSPAEEAARIGASWR